MLNRSFILFSIITGVSALVCYLKSRKKRSGERSLEKHLESKGLRVSSESLPNGDRTIRFRGGHEDLMRLVRPDELEKKPPLPPGLHVESLPNYRFGCPHCGKMSLYGEGQWRYHELSRTRGPMDNTTTFLARCRNCDGFMKCTVDHDD